MRQDGHGTLMYDIEFILCDYILGKSTIANILLNKLNTLVTNIYPLNSPTIYIEISCLSSGTILISLLL